MPACRHAASNPQSAKPADCTNGGVRCPKLPAQRRQCGRLLVRSVGAPARSEPRIVSDPASNVGQASAVEQAYALLTGKVFCTVDNAPQTRYGVDRDVSSPTTALEEYVNQS